MSGHSGEFGADVRLVAGSCEGVHDAVRSYVCDIGWEILDDRENIGCVLIKAKRPRVPKLTRDGFGPTVAVWTLQSEGSGVRVAIRFFFEGHFRFALQTLVAFQGGLLIGSALVPEFLTYVMLMLCVVSSLSVVLAWIGAGGKYAAFTDRFYVRLIESWGARVERQRMANVPEFPLLAMSVVMAVVAAFGGVLQADLLDTVPRIVYPMLVAALGLSVVAFGRSRFGDFLEKATPYLLVEEAIILYAYAPFFAGLLSVMPEVPTWFAALSMFVLAGVAVMFLSMAADTTRELQRLCVWSPLGSAAKWNVWAWPLGLCWILCLVTMAGTIWESSSIWEEWLLGTNHLAWSADVERLATLSPTLKVIIGLWACPIVGAIGLVAFRRQCEVREVRRLVAESIGREALRVGRSLEAICSKEGVDTPAVVLENRTGPMAQVRWVHSIGAVFAISNALVRLLDDDELSAVMWHETWHLKRHVRVYARLRAIADWTLCGRAVFASLPNTEVLEYEADEFAVRELEAVGKPRSSLVRALEKIVALDAAADRAWSRPLQVASWVGGSSDGTRQGVASLLWELLVGDGMVPYVHPSLSARIKRIEAIRL